MSVQDTPRRLLKTSRHCLPPEVTLDSSNYKSDKDLYDEGVKPPQSSSEMTDHPEMRKSVYDGKAVPWSGTNHLWRTSIFPQAIRTSSEHLVEPEVRK